jgi:predicted peptidase
MPRLSVPFLMIAGVVGAFGQGLEPEVRSLGKELQAKTVFLNPEYLLFAPATKADAKLPLVIYLHGAGGVGNEIRKIKGQPLAVVEGIAKFEKGPCFVVAPQCLKVTPAGRGTWTPEDLNVFLEHLRKSLPVDGKRIYLTGNSMGGYGCWVWGGHHPEHFAAVAPVVGGIGRGGPKEVTRNLDAWAANLAKVPVYAFAGGKDRVVPAERSERMVAAIRKAGGTKAKIKVYPGEGHNARQVVYTTAEFYDWMFSKKRD